MANIIGTKNADILVAPLLEASTMSGKKGNDTMTGSVFDDTMFGGKGNDVMNGGDGADRMFGGKGDDIMNGGTNADTMFGGKGNDVMNGDQGNDSMFGGKGDDDMNGGANDDVLQGGKGNDRVDGGEGNDRLWGGKGADTFVFDFVNDPLDVEVIEDFKNGVDRIEMQAGGALNFALLQTFFTQQGADVVITAGNPLEEIRIKNLTVAQLDASDFIFL